MPPPRPWAPIDRALSVPPKSLDNGGEIDQTHAKHGADGDSYSEGLARGELSTRPVALGARAPGVGEDSDAEGDHRPCKPYSGSSKKDPDIP